VGECRCHSSYYEPCLAPVSAQAMELLECFPIRLKAAHLLCCPPKVGKKREVNSTIKFTEGLFEKFGARACTTTVKKMADLPSELAKFGFEERSLPLSCGGTWFYEEYVVHMRQQHKEEQNLWNEMVPTADEESPSSPASDHDVKDRSRKLNAINSRLTRERNKSNVRRLQNECKEIEAANSVLKADNAKFEELLEQAKAAVTSQIDN